MTRVFLVRHAVTQHNLEGIFQGSQDEPLNHLGEAQADLLGRHFSNIPIHSVYSSPLLRALQTAERIAEQHGIAVQPVPAFHEIYAGDFEGNTAEKNRKAYPEQFHNMQNDCTRFCPPNGESFHDMYRRVSDALMSILSQERGRSMVIVTHFFPALVIANCIEGRSLEHFQSVPSLNASISLFEDDAHGCLRTTYLNHVAHLTAPDGTQWVYEAGAYFAK
jgi:broad specificity phosphatase PhoE